MTSRDLPISSKPATIGNRLVWRWPGRLPMAVNFPFAGERFNTAGRWSGPNQLNLSRLEEGVQYLLKHVNRESLFPGRENRTRRDLPAERDFTGQGRLSWG